MAGVTLDTRYADFANSFDSGDNVNFSYSVLIPGIAPKGNYAI